MFLLASETTMLDEALNSGAVLPPEILVDQACLLVSTAQPSQGFHSPAPLPKGMTFGLSKGPGLELPPHWKLQGRKLPQVPPVHIGM